MINLRHLFYYFFSHLAVDRICLNTAPRVLFYHGVAEKIKDSTIETESIKASDFERQLKYIIKYFSPISVDRFYEKFVNQSWKGGEILLTFDDGYKNMLYTALPLLEKYNVPFVLFITTENITDSGLFPTTINRIVNLASSHRRSLLNPQSVADSISRRLKTEPLKNVDELCTEMLSKISGKELELLRKEYSSINPMNWDEVREISKSPLCHIGSHCVNHICCHDKQDEDEVRRQFSQSKKEIETRLGVQCKYLSYPNGNYTPRVEAIAGECGYKMAFSTKYRVITGPDADNMAVGRI